eukprot:331530-Pelagomonas_calceolata.AAC.3
MIKGAPTDSTTQNTEQQTHTSLVTTSEGTHTSYKLPSAIPVPPRVVRRLLTLLECSVAMYRWLWILSRRFRLKAEGPFSSASLEASYCVQVPSWEHVCVYVCVCVRAQDIQTRNRHL